MDTFWSRLERLQGRTLRTLRGASFDVIAVDRDKQVAAKILIRSTGKTRTITRDELARASTLATISADLAPSALRARGISEANPAYLAAILRAVARDANSH